MRYWSYCSPYPNFECTFPPQSESIMSGESRMDEVVLIYMFWEPPKRVILNRFNVAKLKAQREKGCAMDDCCFMMVI